MTLTVFMANWGWTAAAFFCIYAGEAIRAGHDHLWSWQGWVGVLFYVVALALVREAN